MSAESILLARIGGDPKEPVGHQVNVSMTKAEAERVHRLAEDLGWTNRAVVAIATEMLEATLQEIRANGDKP